nr:SDR family NAD(P)-dependent oxidoreductase [Allorhizocola rhizosphaerae]
MVITGASSGIGAAAAVEMARRGWRVTLVGRDPSRLSASLDAVPGEPTAVQADFSRLADVRELAKRLLSGPRIDVLANNAGLVARGSTVDGFHTTMQVNHLAPFLLSHLLLPHLDGGRIINTASLSAAYGLDPTPPTRAFPSAWLTYCTSKKANIYFTAEASRRWPSVASLAFHPGVPRTRFGTPAAQLFYRIAPGLPTSEQAARELVRLATEPVAQLVNGGYYYNGRLLSGPERRKTAASRLWDATASALDL